MENFKGVSKINYSKRNGMTINPGPSTETKLSSCLQSYCRLSVHVSVTVFGLKCTR